VETLDKELESKGVAPIKLGPYAVQFKTPKLKRMTPTVREQLAGLDPSMTLPPGSKTAEQAKTARAQDTMALLILGAVVVGLIFITFGVFISRKFHLTERASKKVEKTNEKLQVQTKLAYNWAPGKEAKLEKERKKKQFGAETWSSRIADLEEMGSPRGSDGKMSSMREDLALEDHEDGRGAGGLGLSETQQHMKRLSTSTSASTGEAERSDKEKDRRRREQKQLQSERADFDLDSFLAKHSPQTSPRGGSSSPSSLQKNSNEDSTLKKAVKTSREESPRQNPKRMKMKMDAARNPFESSEELPVVKRKVAPTTGTKKVVSATSSSASSSSDSSSSDSD
jgi:hypothetical protein